MALWMNQGKINLTLNSKNVVGVGTAFFTSAVPARPGQPLVVNGLMMEIASVDSDTTLTLAQNYTGATASNLNYFIMTTMEGSYNDLSRRAAQVMGYFQGYLDIYDALFTGTGNVTVTMPDGDVVVLPCWSDMMKVENIKPGTMQGPMSVANIKSAIKVNNPSSISYQDGSNAMFHHMVVANSFQINSGSTGGTNLWNLSSTGDVTQKGATLNVFDANSKVTRSAAGQIRVTGSASGFLDGASGAYVSSNLYYTGTAWGKWAVGAVGGMLGLDSGNLSYSVADAGTLLLTTRFLVSSKGAVFANNLVDRSWNNYGVAAYSCAELTGTAGMLRGVLSYPFKIAANYAVDMLFGTYSENSNASNLFHVMGCSDGGNYNPAWWFGNGGNIRYYSSATVGTIGTINSSSPMTGPSFTPTSDARLKPESLRKDIGLVSALLRKLKPKYFFKKYSLDSDQGFFEFGFIADEVEEHEPRLVFETNDEHHLKHLAITGVIPHLVKGWQEHDERLGAVEILLQDIDKRLKDAGI